MLPSLTDERIVNGSHSVLLLGWVGVSVQVLD